VAELVYAADLKSVGSNPLPVQVRPPAPIENICLANSLRYANLIIILIEAYDSMSCNEIHDHLLKIAKPLSDELFDAISCIGPIEYKTSNDKPFPEYLCRAIAGQQISVKAAASIWGRVEESVGQGAMLDHFTQDKFDNLRGCGLSGAKTKTIITIAETHRGIGLDTDELQALCISERTTRLTAMWGVGQWTADMMNMFYFGEMDIWPDGDVAARKTLERLTSKRRKTVRTAQRFAPYRSVLALYMWAHVDAIPDSKSQKKTVTA
jgi:DNA-3-methyladenine glycosylase II